MRESCNCSLETAATIVIDQNMTGDSVTLTGLTVEFTSGTTITATIGTLDLNGTTTTDLDGTGTVILQTTVTDGSNVLLGAVTASGTNNDLTINSTEGVTLSGSVNIGATEDLNITFDTVGGATDAVTFTASQTITANDIDVSGTGGNDSIDVSSAIIAAGNVSLDTAATIDIDQNITGDIVTLTGTTVEIAGGTTITAANGNLDLSGSTTNLDGTGAVILQTTVTDGSNVLLGAVTASGTNNDLTINSTEGVTLSGSVNIGTTEDLDITFDTIGGGTDAVTFTTGQTITPNDIDVSGTGGTDSIDVTTAISAAGNVRLEPAAASDHE